MASLRFLGFSTPSALPYLVNEGILPPDPPESSYTWTTYHDHTAKVPAFDELLSTDYCVVWSRGRIVQRVFSFDVEQQKVQHAILTRFPETSEKASQHASIGEDLGELDHVARKRRKFVPNHGLRSDDSSGDSSRALVIFLKLQAHIFFLSGASHVMNLPFEVEKVLSSPKGLILQRKIPPAVAVPATPVVPPPPNNSFFSPLSTHGPQPSQASRFNDKRKPQEKGPRLDFDLFRPTQASVTDNLPRHFTLTDPLSEVGLIVNTKKSSVADRRASQLSTFDLDTLSKDEEIVYFSPTDEVPPGENDTSTPLLLMVTANHQKRTYSIWYTLYLGTRPVSTLFAGRKTPSGAPTRRRSSFVSATGTTTPTVRGRESIRESFGGIGRGKSISGLTEGALRASQTTQSAEDAILSQLDPDNDTRQPAKESRRVSSLLSRAELSTNLDRSTFHDLATQHAGPIQGGQQPRRRGHSLGASTSRNSLGFVGLRRNVRASTPGSLSRLSSDETSETGTVLNFGASTSATIDELDEEDELNYPLEGEADVYQPMDGLKREIFAIQVCSDIPMGDNAVYLEKNVEKGFTSHSPRLPTKRNSAIGRRFYIHILSPASSHIQVELSATHRKWTSQPARFSPKAVQSQTFIVPQLLKIDRRDGVGGILQIHGPDAVWIAYHPSPTARSKPAQVSVGPAWCPEIASEYDLTNVDLTTVVSQDLWSKHSGESSADSKATGMPSLEICGLEHNGPTGTFDVLVANGKRLRMQADLTPRNSLVRRVLEACIFVLPTSIGAWTLRDWQQLRSESPASPNAELDAVLQVLLRFALCLGEPSTKQLATSNRPRGTQPFTSDANTAARGTMATNDMVSRRLQKSTQTCRVPEETDGSPRFISILDDARKYAASEQGAAYRLFIHRDVHLARLGLARLLVALHLALQERKLNVLTPSAEGQDLVAVVCQLARWMAWSRWDWKPPSYYILDLDLSKHYDFDESSLQVVSCPELQYIKEPPSIFAWLERCCKAPEYEEKFPTISSLFEQPHGNGHEQMFHGHQREYNQHHLEAFAASATPRTAALLKYFECTRERHLPAQKQVEVFVECGITTEMLETFPEAIAAPFKDAISRCQAHPSTVWPAELLRLVSREELTLIQGKAGAHMENSSLHPLILSRDIHSVCQSAEAAEPPATPDMDRWSISRLIFSEDRRFIEALRMIEPVRLTVAECVPDPSWSEARLFEAQKEIVQLVMVRTFALAPGLGMGQYNSRRPLLTEKYVIHGYSTACLMKPMNNTIMADRATYTEEKYGWAWFHAGVAAGLAISKDAQGIDTSWIVFNKPAEPNNRHAGLLLALGLNGHLKGIAKWLAFKYLTPKHTMTSIGLLLGMSASHLGTMDTLVTRLLSVHVTRMLPPGAAELNLSPLAQTTGLMGIGLLYYNTQHRRMTEIMLSEIESTVSDDPSSGSPDPIRDESYRLAAGFALGYINIGAGKDLKGLHDMRLVDRLLGIAVGPRPVDSVHILDQATAGATIAIALIFMKTHNMAVARKIDIPDTLPQFDYVRPDILLLRTLAKHLILWSSIQANDSWILENLPSAYHALHTLAPIKDLSSKHLPLYTILTGLLFAIALRHSGSASIAVRDFLIAYLDQFIRLSRLPATHYDARLTRSTVHHCLDLVALCCATVMAGTGDIPVMRRLRLLHGRVNAETSYGSHMASHMALGALFLGGGSYSFGTSDIGVASLIVSFYPLFPSAVDDSRAHLQALRHFWVLAVEARCIVVRDAESKKPISLPLAVTMRIETGEEEVREFKAPCLLPDLATVLRVHTKSEEYWPISLNFKDNLADLERFKTDQTLFVRKKPPHQPGDSPFSAFWTHLYALNDMHTKSAKKSMPWEWLFELPSFKEFRKTEFGLVVPGDDSGGNRVDERGSVVDDRLVLRKAAEDSGDRDRLWNLRVLFAWAERQVEDNGDMRYLGRDVIERLRGMIERRIESASDGGDI